jgi:hypothetical protein
VFEILDAFDELVVEGLGGVTFVLLRRGVGGLEEGN